jgi:hypothetical protein
MEQSLSWEANSHSSSQEIPHLLCNPKVHYRVHKGSPLVPVLSQMIQSTPSHRISLKSILILPFRLRLGFPSDIFHLDFPTKFLHEFLIAGMRATYPTNLILLDLITLLILGETYKLWGSSLCSLVLTVARWKTWKFHTVWKMMYVWVSSGWLNSPADSVLPLLFLEVQQEKEQGCDSPGLWI